MSKPDKGVEEAKQRFHDATDAWATVRQDFAEDLRFGRLGIQWPAAVKAARERAMRPCLTINKLPPMIRQVVNDGRMNRPAIEVKPVDGGADPETAKVLAGIIKNIEYASNASVAYDTGLDFAVSGGFGFWRVDIEYAGPRSFDTEIRIKQIANPLTVVMPADAQGADGEDWPYGFITDLIPKKEFERLYKGARTEGFQSDDKYDAPWWDKSGEMVRVAEYYCREEVETEIVLLSNGLILDAEKLEKDMVLRASLEAQGVTVQTSRKIQDYKLKHQIMSGAEVLEETKWPGKFVPIIPCFGEDINVEGKRYLRSLIRDARDPQQMLNYWRTATTEVVALAPKAPWIGPKGAFQTDAAKWATANTQNHAFIEYDPVPGGERPRMEPFAGIPAGALQEALNAADDIKATTGLFDASMGARSNETSGRAIMFRQREGDVSTFHFIDNLTRAIRYTGKVLVDIIPHIYSEAKIVRVLGEDMKPQQVAIGPRGSQVPEGFERVYDLGTGNYDVTCTAGPNFTTMREQTANQMLEFVRVLPAAAPLMGDMIAKNMDWNGADELGERLKALLPPQISGQGQQDQGPPPEVNAIQAKTAAEIQAMQAKTAEKIKADNAIAANKLANNQRDAEQKRAIKLEEAQLDAILKASKSGAAAPPVTPVQPLT